MGVDVSATAGIGILLTQDEINRLIDRVNLDEDLVDNGSPSDELEKLLTDVNEKYGASLTYAEGGSYYTSGTRYYAVLSRTSVTVDSGATAIDARVLLDDRDRRALDEVLWFVMPDDELQFSRLGERLKLVALLLWH